jgi:NADH-quinone oxidoreductase subunit N
MDTWTLILPELVLAVAGLLALAAGVIPKRDTSYAVNMAVLGAFLIAAVLVMMQPEGTAFAGQYVADSSPSSPSCW